MKKFNILIGAVSLLYVSLAVFILFKLHNNNVNDKWYRIEINRIMADLYDNYDSHSDLTEINFENYLENYKCIKKIEFMQVGSSNTEIEKFYDNENNYEMEVRPFWIEEVGENVLGGYIKFSYIDRVDTKQYIYIIELMLFISFVICLAVLLYVRSKVINPFLKLKELPYELSKGNFTYELKENKDKYFGKFVWGINMLKDNLDIHKKQELKVLKEKKMILLSISHDIKTPLNAIRLYSRLLREGIYDSPESIKEIAGSIDRNVEEIDEFVKQVIKSSKEEIINVEVSIEEFYLRDLVDKIKLGYEEKCDSQHIALTMSEYTNYLLKGDLDKLYEVIQNIMENAFKYGDGRKIRITFSEEEYYLLITIFNTGDVVEERDMIHLFESFYRGSNVEGKQGNGLGLYICNEIMKKMNGDIYAVRHKEGMEFVIVCPISQ
ncbi:HAMP domain-containing histidine kinase [Clostridium sp. MSJ-8]|uniref:sensor histidine kinase n=1 Tax=Clostridium sp. MSJ-8 TaxID=2841510 RepID=UPI001C0EA8E3|nr:HAMP domain-containing sensor histidine kinase [Clostridium sp. MSJ-8]MBU5486573.1 HAMP domain-containing histidine kinase [Clostridium sp. MSJ-8]